MDSILNEVNADRAAFNGLGPEVKQFQVCWAYWQEWATAQD
jgi:hypothetical protein